MKEFGSKVYAAVKSGKLNQPFNAAMAKKACPGWVVGTYHTFFAKHAIGNPGSNTELFVRVARGSYRLSG